MKLSTVILTCMLVSGAAGIAHGQLTKAEEQRVRRSVLQKPDAQRDRAGGTHDKSNIGLFFENRGRLYPTTIAQGVSGEWPIRSGHEFIYRANPIVAIPGNVIQSRFSSSTEWEAAAGYKNPDSVKIAFSDQPKSWPASGWPVKDAAGNPVIVSDQDSYCVYNDSTNRKAMLNLEIHQIGYAFGSKQVRDMLFYTFKIVNRSAVSYDSLYFGMYLDIDVGDVSGGVEEYADDFAGFNKDAQIVYFFDDGTSSEWPGVNTGYFGFTMLGTPSVGGTQLGITDFHYNLYDDDAQIETDTVHYGILSSARSLRASALGPKYFHQSASQTDIHFDDVATIPATGLDLASNTSSGPYVINPGDTLTFVTAFVAGNSLQEIGANTLRARALYASNFVTARPPVAPKITVTPGNKSIRVAWDNKAENSRDFGSGQLDFEGYRLYRSIDRGIKWDQIDRNQYPSIGADPVPLAEFDRINGIGADKGLHYSYVDTAVVNGFEYWYSVTSYDRGDSVTASLESSLGSSTSAENLGIGIPRTSAIGRTAPLPSSVTQTGGGSAKVNFLIQPTDVPTAAGVSCVVSFSPTIDVRQGNLRSQMTVSVDSNMATTAHVFALTFTSATRYRVRDMKTGSVVDSGAYVSGSPILFSGLRLVLVDTSVVTDDRPEASDSLWIMPGIRIASGSTEVLPLQPLSYGTWYATSDGIIVAVQQADTAAAFEVTYKDRFAFTTSQPVVDTGRETNELNRIKVVPNPYLISSLYEEEFGTRGARREPIRQIKFNNLPSKCTITIFTMDGDQVIQLDHESNSGTVTWNMRSGGNREIAPGVYFYLVKTATAEHLGRFAVIK